MRSRTGAISSSYLSRDSFEEASMSFMMDSTERGASMLADRIFLRRSQPTARRKVAFGLERTSILYFVLNSVAKCCRRA